MDMTNVVIFTDMDGTLLDHHSYSHQAANALLGSLEQASIPVIPTTSKTFAELQQLRLDLNNQHPFICENGAGVYIPRGYFSPQLEGLSSEGEFWVKAFVEPRSHWRELLAQLPANLTSQFTTFTDLGIEGIMRTTGLPEAQAKQSADRHFGEPVQWHGREDLVEPFCQAVADLGGNTLVGGRFIHVSGATDKGRALRWLVSCYQAQLRSPITTIALGDGGNDVAMLATADYPIIVRSPSNPPPELPASATNIDRLIITQQTAPHGWVEGVSQVLSILSISV